MIGRAVVLHMQNDKGPAFQPFGDSGGPQAAGAFCFFKRAGSATVLKALARPASAALSADAIARGAALAAALAAAALSAALSAALAA